MKVFSISKFKADKNITKREIRSAMKCGWPQECEGKPVEDLEYKYAILDKWTEELDPRMAKQS